MKYRLVNNDGKFQLLLFNGEIHNLTAEEARRYIFNFDSIEFPDAPNEMSMFDNYLAEPIASMDDDGNLIVHNARLLRELALPAEFPYYSVPEYADLCGKKTSIVRRMCVEGRIEGAVQVAATWLIPKTAPYPDRKPRENKPKQ